MLLPILISLNLRKKSGEVSIETRSTPATLSHFHSKARQLRTKRNSHGREKHRFTNHGIKSSFTRHAKLQMLIHASRIRDVFDF